MRWWEKQKLDGCEVCTRQKQSGVYFSQLPFRELAEIGWESGSQAIPSERARCSSLLVSSDLESIKVAITCGARDQRIVNYVLWLNMWTQNGLLDHSEYISWTPVNADAPPVWLECGCPRLVSECGWWNRRSRWNRRGTGVGHSHHHRRNYLCLNSHFLYGLSPSANRRFTCQSDNVDSYWRASLILS